MSPPSLANIVLSYMWKNIGKRSSPASGRTIAFKLLPQNAMHELPTHITEGGAKEGVAFEAVRDINLEPLLQILCGGGINVTQAHTNTYKIYATCAINYRNALR